MTVKRLKEILNNLDDNLEIKIRNSINICGNISDLEQVEYSNYQSFGKIIPCLILNTLHNMELDICEETKDYIAKIESNRGDKNDNTRK